MKYRPVPAKRKGEKFFAPTPQRKRRSIRLKHYDYSQAGAYFATLCTRERKCLFGNIVEGEIVLNDAGRLVKKCWLDIPEHFPHVELDEFIIMPNHVHGILVITDSPLRTDSNVDASVVGAKNFPPLHFSPERGGNRPMGTSKTVGSVVRGFKIGVTKWMRGNTGIHDVWQRNYYERIIRNETELDKIREYIINNPLNWQSDENYNG